MDAIEVISQYSSKSELPRTTETSSGLQAVTASVFASCQKYIAETATSTGDNVTNLAVFVKSFDGTLVHEPSHIDSNLLALETLLQHPAAVIISCALIDDLASRLSPFQREFSLGEDGPVVPILRSLHTTLSGEVYPPHDAYACVFRQERLLLLWSGSAQSLLSHVDDVLEHRLPQALWAHALGGSLQPSRPQTPRTPRTPKSPSLYPQQSPSLYQPQPYTASSFHLPSSLPSIVSPQTLTAMPSTPPSTGHGSVHYLPQQDIAMSDALKEKYAIIERAVEVEERGPSDFDAEKGSKTTKRPFLLTHACLVTAAVALAVIVQLASIAELLKEWRLDGTYERFALVALIPMFLGFSLFFFVVVIGSLFQLFAPLSGLRGNSRFYSGVKPKPGNHKGLALPHITVQMPVYKEGLAGVIMPTLNSVMAAIRYYEAQGGTASIFVNDDGMQLVTADLAEARKAYYEVNRVGWCSRRGHCEDKESPNYFLRKGKFKKASNMNYCLYFAMRVEDQWLKLMDDVCQQRGISREDLSVDEELQLYEAAKESILEQDGGKTQAGGDCRLGELILIIDSDTRVPEDCLLYGALEMEESPEVALLQHASGVMQVTNKFFENGITWFTNLIYTQIQFAVGSGDVAPFVGHNTFLRWRALQSIAFVEDDRIKFWSESHVSEDFDVSLRVQMQGFTVRMATYHDGGFKEGVSLTVYDELARWEKYAYGCNELVFNPLIRWPSRGPFTRLFLRFLCSNIKITSKVTILGYILTYYAVASAVPLAFANYIMVGWFGDDIDHFYLTSWKMWVGMAVIFNALSPLAYAWLRHRAGQQSFLRALWDCIKWCPMFILFFGGLSTHIFLAICCHFFSINISWTTTAKELQQTSFKMGVDRVLRDFRWMYLALFPVVGGMIYLGTAAPDGWKITDFTAIVPLANQVGCHILLPFILGPFASQFW